MWGIDEDVYWERVREEREKPRYTEWEESDSLFLDEELDEIEERYGCSIEELYEADLEEIVEEMTGIVPLSAKYDKQFMCIDYKYMQEAS